MSEPPVCVRMSGAGTLHLAHEGASRMLCGVPAEYSKAATWRGWENEESKYRCKRCMARLDGRLIRMPE